MRLLLDTHILVWTVLEPSRLLPAERAAMDAAEGALVISAVSIWELRLKWHRFHVSGARKGPIAPEAIVAVAAAAGWETLPLTPRHAAASLDEALDHADPFDELLLVQAQQEGLRLLTRDAKLAMHPMAARLPPPPR